MSGICALTSQQKYIEIYGREKKSFEKFLNGQHFKIVGLSKVLGIGGEGIVIKKELEITLMEARESDDRKKAERIRLKSKENKIVAVKFVPFKKDDRENFQGKGFIIRANFITVV